MVEEDRLDVLVARDDVVVDRRRVEDRRLAGRQLAHDRERVLQVARRERVEVGVDRAARRDGAGHALTMTRAPRSCNTVAARMSADPPFTDEHETLRESIRRFVANELRPHAAEWEEARWFPDEVFARLARAAASSA